MSVKFLIVDDSKAMQTIVKRIVSNAGYQSSEFRFADDGEQALEIIVNWKPDMVLLDWHMPKMSGIELLRTVKKQRIPVKIGMITAEKDEVLMRDAFACGAKFIVHKPFTVNSLKEKLIPTLSGSASVADTPIFVNHEIILPSPSAIALLMSTITSTPITVEACSPIKTDSLTLPCRVALYGDADGAIKAVQVLDANCADRLAEAFASSVYRGQAFDDALLAKSLLKALSVIAACFHNISDSKELRLVKSFSMNKNARQSEFNG